MLEKLMQKEFVFLDGAMGTVLQSRGLPTGGRPELLAIHDPEQIAFVHRAYLDAGSEIIYANTFGASRRKLEGSGVCPADVISAAIRTAKNAVGTREAAVALDLGPIGELLEPTGTLTFEAAYESYCEQVRAGTQAGADLIVLETMTDLYEVKAALLACQEHSQLPVFVTMTFEENGRTFSGCCLEAFAEVAEGLGASAIGINCSLGPRLILPMIERLGGLTNLPLIVKPNAGLPDAATGHYSTTPEEFAREMAGCAAAGAQLLGGCCGTNPEFIRALCDEMKGMKRAPRTVIPVSRICTPTRAVALTGDVCVIGERINPTGKPEMKRALQEGNLNYLLTQAVQQGDAGAAILDINVGLPGVNEPEMMRRAVKAVQSVSDLPLQIDADNPETIEAGLRVCNGKAIVNSVTGEEERLAAVLPLVKKYGAAVVGLTIDENGIPETAEGRLAIAERILRAADACGIDWKDVYIDPLTLAVSAQQREAAETLKAISMIREKLGVHTVLGVSNISFGLPNRGQITGTFLAMALQRGLDLPILNPNAPGMMETVDAFRVLTGQDIGCSDYIARCAGNVTSMPSAVQHQGCDLGTAVERGLREEAGRLARELLAERTPLSIVDEILVPALDRLGTGFEQGTFFLPQLLRGAEAAGAAFEVVRAALSKDSLQTETKGKILVATVKGDIHDIGKNIAKTLLENYGYEVLDLGRDVPPEAVVNAVKTQNIQLVGLSALMTTTLKSMEETISALRSCGCDCRVFAGGAILTEDYAKTIGADFYAGDAKRSVDIAKEVLG